MKILVVSDSHGRNVYLEKVLETVEPDMLIHLGDLEGSEIFIQNKVSCPVEMVSGNNDYFSDLEREKLITIGRYKVLLTHGHRYRVHYGTETIKDWARQMGADIVMFGHTHMPLLDTSTDVTALNPGSISQPRQEGRIPTYAIVELDRNGEIHFTLNYVK
ncbi:metallophosphoesterase [Acetivibrio ethanolgignens]|uniref:Phosphoesterase n=1 Tax=Acetivibrio ethanolgignens TaxID=290052 RepID=A0A0V8QCA8_9FIRM|nr:metallophosphoesterase [Acetivibrio ethanolgignens]KSV58148.1 phosphodiesterase [Acetivibrio ethanolgignens]